MFTPYALCIFFIQPEKNHFCLQGMFTPYALCIFFIQPEKNHFCLQGMFTPYALVFSSFNLKKIIFACKACLILMHLFFNIHFKFSSYWSEK
jgi:hypothetical protein